VIAGLSTIPAFVHKTPSSYTQVAENLHRADLSPMEIALFIQRRLDNGEMKQDIAARLGYKKSYVTEHLALLESPACVEKAYASGVASARTLYDLRRLHEEFPHEVDAWIASGSEVTRESIVAFAQKIRHDELAGKKATVSWKSADALHHQGRASPQISAPAPSRAAGPEAAVEAEADASPGLDEARSSSHHPSPKSLDIPVDVDRPSRKLRIKVNHEGRSALIDEDSVVRIRYEDGGMAEVRLAEAVVIAAVAA
jgi:ParB family chromosome partitioning protein